MPFPPEFNYANEDDFIQKFIIPLLQRLGFSTVVNHHGRAELGRDLIFAEIDRFGHVKYHGLQAKYVERIRLSETQSIIEDCRQAFANPFTHPQTRKVERISSFYVFNGGTIGDEAATHFFNSLTPFEAANTKLIHSKDLIVLDRWASSSRAENVSAMINGLLIELSVNERHYMPPLLDSLQDSIRGVSNVSYPIERLRVNASSNYLSQPVLSGSVNTDAVFQYSHLAVLLNSLIDHLVKGAVPEENKVQLRPSAVDIIVQLNALTSTIRAELQSALATLQPLAAI
ncbi:hypothetical protein EON83_00155 [bacterium]|nr:MAG: hypothetical protein EON83_00155 [bacterium]